MPPALRQGTPYGDMLVRATRFLREGAGTLDSELADFLVAREMGWDWDTLQRQPRLWRQMCIDFILAGGLRR